MSKIAQDEIATTMLLSTRFNLGAIEKMTGNLKSGDTGVRVEKEASNFKKRSFEEIKKNYEYIYVNDEQASMPGYRPDDDIIMKIYRNEVTKKIRMDNRAITSATYSLRELQKQDGVPITIATNPTFEYFNKMCSGCRKDDCTLHLIPTMLDDPLKSHSVMNHIIRCSNPLCSSISCILVKNMLKFNIINSDNALLYVNAMGAAMSGGGSSI